MRLAGDSVAVCDSILSLWLSRLVLYIDGDTSNCIPKAYLISLIHFAGVQLQPKMQPAYVLGTYCTL